MASRNGDGRHRQPWITVACPHCGLDAPARKTRPKSPLHIKTHFDADGFLCPPYTVGASRVMPPREKVEQFPGQGRLFA